MSARKRNMNSNDSDGVFDSGAPGVGSDAPAPDAPPESTPVVTNVATQPVSKWKTNAAKHAAAAMLHNWAQYEHNNGREMQLTRVDYNAAIEAASKRFDRKYKPHAPALYTKKVK